jgi:hypothetical protein
LPLREPVFVTFVRTETVLLSACTVCALTRKLVYDNP